MMTRKMRKSELARHMLRTVSIQYLSLLFQNEQRMVAEQCKLTICCWCMARRKLSSYHWYNWESGIEAFDSVRLCWQVCGLWFPVTSEWKSKEDSSITFLRGPRWVPWPCSPGAITAVSVFKSSMAIIFFILLPCLRSPLLRSPRTAAGWPVWIIPLLFGGPLLGNTVALHRWRSCIGVLFF